MSFILILLFRRLLILSSLLAISQPPHYMLLNPLTLHHLTLPVLHHLTLQPISYHLPSHSPSQHYLLPNHSNGRHSLQRHLLPVVSCFPQCYHPHHILNLKLSVIHFCSLVLHEVMLVTSSISLTTKLWTFRNKVPLFLGGGSACWFSAVVVVQVELSLFLLNNPLVVV